MRDRESGVVRAQRGVIHRSRWTCQGESRRRLGAAQRPDESRMRTSTPRSADARSPSRRARPSWRSESRGERAHARTRPTLAGHGGRRGRGSGHPRGPGAAAAGRAGRLGGGRGALAGPALRGPVRPGRSARRHARVPRRPRRIHGQYRAGADGVPVARRRRGAGARPALARRRRPRRRAAALCAGRTAGAASDRTPHPHPAATATAARGCSRSHLDAATEAFLDAACRGRAFGLRLGDEILPRRRRRRRPLSAARADLRMGRCGRPRACWRPPAAA